MNRIQRQPGEIIATGPSKSAGLANVRESADSWNGMDDSECAKMEQRLLSIVMANGPVDFTKMRQIKGNKLDIYEIKIRKPDIGAYAFKEQAVLRITHIEQRPHNNRVQAEAKRADRIRTEHQRGQRTNA